MSDPNRRHHLSFRLAQAAVTSWGFLQDEMDQLENASEQAYVYLESLALLTGYLLHAAEVLSKTEYPREEFDEAMRVLAEDVWRKIERMRRQEEQASGRPLLLPEDEPTGVH